MQLLIYRQSLPISHTLRCQFCERSFEVTMVGIAVTGCGRSEFGLVVDLVPCDDVLATGSDRSTDREDQSAFKRNLQQSQYTATKTIIRKITHTGEAHGIIRLTRIWMFVTLNSGWNAEKIKMKIDINISP